MLKIVWLTGLLSWLMALSSVPAALWPIDMPFPRTANPATAHSMNALTGVDIVVLLLVVGGGVLGWMRGFVTELLSLFAWVAVVIALKAFHVPATALLAAHMSHHSAAAVAAFALIAIIVFVGGRFIARALGRRTRTSVLGPVDRVLGLGFGAVKGLIGATLVFLLFSLVYNYVYGPAAERPAELRDSRTFPLLNASGRAVVGFLNAHRASGGESGGSPENASAPK